jgi:uncharacterized protein (DUF488 family)
MKTPDSPAQSLYSVGHSNHDEAAFLALLRSAGITAIADVRSSPYSRRLPQFSRSTLEPWLRQHDIAYVFLGGQLGGRPADETLYDPDERGQLVVNYERLRATAGFQAGLDRLARGRERHTIAFLCSEEDPLDCHRGLMITPALVERGIQPLHLRRGGVIETTPELERRLLQEAKLDAGVLDSLFPVSAEEYAEVLAQAYRVLNQRVAFRLEGEG